MQAHVWDLSAPDDAPLPFEEGSADVAVAIFVLSALHPDQLSQAIRNILRVGQASHRCGPSYSLSLDASLARY